MAYITQRIAFATGTTSATVSIPAGIAPYNLVVIDNIIASGTCAADTAGQVNITGTAFNGGASFILSYFPVYAVSCGTFVLPAAAGGIPLWSANHSNLAADTGSILVNVNAAGTLAQARLYITYHYAKPQEYTT